MCLKDGVILHQGIFSVDTVDTTAAGDTFTGYFVAALDAGCALPEALRNAAAASAIAVTRHGAAPSIPYAQEVADFLAERS